MPKIEIGFKENKEKKMTDNGLLLDSIEYKNITVDQDIS